MKDYSKEIKDFYRYVSIFYNLEGGIYPIASYDCIIQSTNIYLESKPLSQIQFDSFDREQVRNIIGK
tara:strand:- start:245 stop:445 length:201 start_codon:yes stop_codon:yes gene_type:complete